MIKRISHWLAVLCAAFAFNTLAHADTNENFGFMEWDAEAAQTAIDNGERVIINAWATWCPFCKAQRRSLAGLLQSDPEGYSDVKVFAIDIDDADKPAMVGGNQYGTFESVHEGRKATESSIPFAYRDVPWEPGAAFRSPGPDPTAHYLVLNADLPVGDADKDELDESFLKRDGSLVFK